MALWNKILGSVFYGFQRGRLHVIGDTDNPLAVVPNCFLYEVSISLAIGHCLDIRQKVDYNPRQKQTFSLYGRV